MKLPAAELRGILLIKLSACLLPFRGHFFRAESRKKLSNLNDRSHNIEPPQNAIAIEPKLKYCKQTFFDMKKAIS